MRCQKSLAISRLRCSCPQTGRRWPLSRNVSNAAARQGEVKETGAEDKTKDEKDNAPTPGKEEEGAMSRRLAEMTEQYLLEGGKSARNNIQHTGFSEELKSKMEERVAAASFKSQHAGAFAVVDMPVRFGLGIDILYFDGHFGPRLTANPSNRTAQASIREILLPQLRGRVPKASTMPPFACSTMRTSRCACHSRRPCQAQ